MLSPSLKQSFSAMCVMVLTNEHKGKKVRKEKKMIQEKITEGFQTASLSKDPESLLLLFLHMCNTSRHGDRETDLQQEYVS